MAKRTAAQIKARAKLAKTVFQHHFGVKNPEIEYKDAGKTNYVFDLKSGRKNYIVRISSSHDKLHDFFKEQWVVQKVREKGVPVPEILEVGNQVIPFPYMLQEKVNGAEAMDHPQRTDVLCDLGKYAKLIHSVETTGFGHNFDWSHNKLSKQNTWGNYLQNELQVNERLKFLQKHNMLPRAKLTRLDRHFKKICKWKFAPCLNHSDLRLKNVLVS